MKKTLTFVTLAALIFSLGSLTVWAAGRHGAFTDANGDGICDNKGQHIVDKDCDGVCDNKGQNFVDEDGDGICDNRHQGHHGNGHGKHHK